MRSALKVGGQVGPAIQRALKAQRLQRVGGWADLAVDYGFPGGSTAIDPYINAWVADFKAGKIASRELILPTGAFNLNDTALVDFSAARITCDGINGTTLIKNFAGDKPALHLAGAANQLRNVGFWARGQLYTSASTPAVNGTTTQFPFTFRCDAAADLRVSLIVGGVETVQTLTTNYTVALNANQTTSPGGTVTFTAAPGSTATVALRSTGGQLLRVKSLTPIPIGEIVIETFYGSVGGGGGWTRNAVEIDGTNADGTSYLGTVYAIGVRGLRFQSATLFGPTTEDTFAIKGLIGGTIVGEGCYPGTSDVVAGTGGVLLDGTSVVQSEDVTIDVGDATRIKRGWARKSCRIIVRSGVATAQGTGEIVSTDAGSRVTLEEPWVFAQPGLKNLTINSQFDFDQRGKTVAANDEYIWDGWFPLMSGAQVGVERVQGSGRSTYIGRLTQNQATAQRFALAQIHEYRDLARYLSNGEFFSWSGFLLPSTTMTVRYALLAHAGSGGTNAVTSSCFTAWGSGGAIGAGGPTLAANLSVVAQGAVSAAGGLWTFFHVAGVPAGGSTNLLGIIWTDATVAQGATVSYSDIQINPGTLPLPIERRSFGQELDRVRRYCQKSFELDTVPANNIGNTVGWRNYEIFRRNNIAGGQERHCIKLPVPLWNYPAGITYYGPLSATAAVRDIEAAADSGGPSTFQSGLEKLILQYTFGAGGAVGNTLAVGWMVEAPL